MNTDTRNREFGLWRATSLVVGNIVGVGIFMLPASLGAFGTLGLLGWLVTAGGSICLALIFAKLSKRLPKIGGPYAYSKEAFGDFIGFQMAWSYWIGTLASNAAIATAFVSYMSFIFPGLSSNRHLAFAIAFGSVWVFTLINMTSIRLSGIVQIIIVILKIIPLCVIGIFGLFHMSIDNFFPINPSGMPVFKIIAASAAMTLFAFLGLESATVPADNVIDPQKTIPRATVIGTVFSAVIFIWTTVVIMGILPAQELAVSNAPFADAAGAMMGNWAAMAIAICAVIAAFGTLNGWILLQGQIPIAAANDGLFPKFLGKLSKNGTPIWSLVISSLFMSVLLYMNYELPLVDQFTSIVTFTTFAVLLPYLYSAAAELYFLLADEAKMNKAQFLRSLLITFVGFAYTLVIVIGSGQEAVYLGMILLFIGFPVFVYIKQKNLRTSPNL